MKKKAPVYLTLGILAASIPAVHAAGVIVDPSFETMDPFVDDGNGVGKWNPFAGGGVGSSTSTLVTTNPRTGNQNLELNLGGDVNQFAGAFQDVTVMVGEIITFAGFHFAANNSPTAIEIRIEWRDSVNDVEVSRTGNSTPSPGGTYEPFSLTETAPAGADTARVVYAAQSFGGSVDAVVSVDDVTVTGVPEPSGSILLALATGLGVMRRRR